MKCCINLKKSSSTFLWPFFLSLLSFLSTIFNLLFSIGHYLCGKPVPHLFPPGKKHNPKISQKHKFSVIQLISINLPELLSLPMKSYHYSNCLQVGSLSAHTHSQRRRLHSESSTFRVPSR